MTILYIIKNKIMYTINKYNIFNNNLHQQNKINNYTDILYEMYSYFIVNRSTNICLYIFIYVDNI